LRLLLPKHSKIIPTKDDGNGKFVELPLMSVQLALLGFLLERDYHGYDLKKTIERLMGQWTDIRFGSIYHALGALEKAGHVQMVATIQSRGKPARSVYSITDSGRDEFHRLLRDNLTDIQRVYLADDIGIFFGKRIERGELTELLARRLLLLEGLLTTLRLHRSKLPNYDITEKAIAEQLISRHIEHLEADCEWFRKIIEKSDEGALY